LWWCLVIARSFRPVVAGLVAACCLVCLAPGCASFSTSTSSPDTNPGPPVHPYEPDASDASYALAAEPSESATVSAPQGSPLCNAPLNVGGCYPDLVTSAQACGLGSDAGESDRAIDEDEPLACRVQPAGDAGDAGVVPACEPAGLGFDGAPCAHGTDCAAGYECVENTCRHYCCAGNSSCAPADFCDIQPTTDSGTLVPVCVPVLPCVLLSQGGCPAGQSCAVVRADGTTSCETVGSGGQGAPCDTQHCAAGLVCLGAVGSRKCYALCYTAMVAACGDGQTCMGGLPLFQDPAVGWCQ
jgi:hypothetical protein